IELRVDVSKQVDQGDLRMLSLWRVDMGAPLSGPAPFERRTNPRARVSFAAVCRWAERVARVNIESLSTGGLFMQTQTLIPSGEELELEWSLPSDSMLVRARSRVLWSRTASAGRPAGLGVRFLAVVPPFAPIASGRTAR